MSARQETVVREYVVPARQLVGTLEEQLEQLDEFIASLVAARRWLTESALPHDETGPPAVDRE